MKRFCLSLSLLALTAACGGSGSGTMTPVTPIDEFRDRLEADQALADRVNKLAGSKFDAIPDAGTGRFEGPAGIFIDPVVARDSDDVVLIGDATLNANFGAGTVRGYVNNLQGVTGDAIIPESDDLYDVAGRVTIGGNGSEIGGASPNRFSTSYSGRLTTPDEVYRLRGTLDGQFVGTRVNNPNTTFPIKALTASDFGGIALDSDGDDAAVQFEIIAVNPIN